MIDPISGKANRILALFSLLVGISFSFGHLAGMYYCGRSYTPLVYDQWMVRGVGSPKYFYALDHVAWDETAAYARYAQEVLRGDFLGATLGSFEPYVKGEARAQSIWCRDRLGPILLAALSAPFGRSVPKAFVAADFLFPALTAFCLLLLCRQLFPCLLLWLFAVSLAVWFSFFDLIGLLYLYWGDPHYGPIFARTAYPQISCCFFALFLIAMLRLDRRRSIVSAAFLGFALLLNFYTYVYSWTLALAMLIVWLILLGSGLPFAGAENAGRRLLAAFIAVPAGLAAAASIPVWLPLAARPAAVQDFFVRLGGTITRQPDWLALLFCSLFAALALGAGRRGWRNGWFWAVFWIACFAVTNEQVISGRTMQPFHYLLFFMGPFFPIFLCDIGYWRWSQSGLGKVLWRRAGLIVAGTVALGFAQCAFRLAQPVARERELHTTDRSVDQVLAVLSMPGLRHEGFLTNDPLLDQILPAYVPQKPLQPWWMDPLGDSEIRALHLAAAHLLEEPIDYRAAHPGPSLRFDPAKTIVVCNRHRPIRIRAAACQVLVSNDDFLVISLAPCGG
jgi:hypothetical protein